MFSVVSCYKDKAVFILVNFVSPRPSMFPEAKPRETKHLKLFCYTSQLKNRLRRNRLLYAGWLTHLPRFQEARPDHVRVESSSCCFPRELVSFVCPREF